MNSKKDVTQGDPLAMIAYGIGVIPPIQELWYAHPHVTQPCYSYDAGVGVSFGKILVHLENLKVRGSPRGYFPEPTNIILVVA